jgi:hypothetical protein
MKHWTKAELSATLHELMNLGLIECTIALDQGRVDARYSIVGQEPGKRSPESPGIATGSRGIGGQP